MDMCAPYSLANLFQKKLCDIHMQDISMNMVTKPAIFSYKENNYKC